MTGNTETRAVARTPDAAAPAVAEASTLAVEGLPVDTLREALPFLRRPFTPEAIRWKVQTVFKEAKGCIVVGYIDARLVIERLNLVVASRWEEHYGRPEGGGPLWCYLAVCGVTRSDLGEGQGRSDGQKAKAEVSDALKRAAVKFGIGVSVYALPQITLFANQPHVEKRGQTLAITEGGHVKLREGYAKWLETHGSKLFGEPLDHGDVEGATFDDNEPGDEFVPEPLAPLEDTRALALAMQIEEAYEAVDKKVLPPARFRAQFAGVRHSHEEMERFLEYLRERAHFTEPTT